MAGDERAPVERSEFWRRTMRGWDLAFYALALVVGVPTAVSALRPPGSATSLLAVAALLVLVVAYVLLGRRAALQGRPRGADAYLVVLVVVTGVATWSGDFGFVLLFIAYSQVWFFSRRRSAGVAWCVALTLVVAGAAVLRLGSWSDEAGEVATQMTISLAFAVVLGLWITQIAEQSEERAGLIERLEHAQAALAAEHHAAGVLAERARVAQEIHDTLAQGFTSVVMLAQTATAELERGGRDEVRRRLAQIEAVARDNLAEARALVAAFGPAALDGVTLGEALERLARRFEAETGVEVVLAGTATTGTATTADGPGRETEVVLLRAAQEALANVRRHADARRVTVRLVHAPGGTRLEVEDDGRGIAPGTPEGTGLRGMRDRAAATGSDLLVGPGPSGGTRLSLHLPEGSR
ncbi:sensor histidine kinase [Cellulomonas marina]|uniref:histidine kinase n=1 Tax=Cellulomonas marina TaxID=988821 RepID=A0A1I0XLW7_9CELL|nr:sensor histidine kinase [Cellulomonas marina]SFB01717.1 Signal transduction histidine kinase [Cellulomonas marina]